MQITIYFAYVRKYYHYFLTLQNFLKRQKEIFSEGPEFNKRKNSTKSKNNDHFRLNCHLDLWDIFIFFSA